MTEPVTPAGLGSVDDVGDVDLSAEQRPVNAARLVRLYAALYWMIGLLVGLTFTIFSIILFVAITTGTLVQGPAVGIAMLVGLCGPGFVVLSLLSRAKRRLEAEEPEQAKPLITAILWIFAALPTSSAIALLTTDAFAMEKAAWWAGGLSLAGVASLPFGLIAFAGHLIAGLRATPTRWAPSILAPLSLWLGTLLALLAWRTLA